MVRLAAHHEQDTAGGPVWVSPGTTFGFDDLVFYRGKGEVDFDDVADRIDLVITGPHATGALPRELEPFLADGITERIQFDFSDHATSALGRRWAATSDHVVYVEFPHHRTMYDPNRPPPRDVEAEVREFWARRHRQQAGDTVSFNGVDAVRPVSFGGVRFLREPDSPAEWRQLVDVLERVRSQGAERYERVRSEVLDMVVEAKCRRLASLPLDQTTVPSFASARHLHVQCLHDTMNTTVGPDGAVDIERPAGDRLPDVVSLGNRGDRRGEPRPPDGGQRLPAADVPTMAGPALRSVLRAMSIAFDVAQADLPTSLNLNHPYLGAYEVQAIARHLRNLQEEAVVRHVSGHGQLSIETGAYQAEFNRELLLGPRNAATVRTPGVHWPDEDHEHVERLAATLENAYDLLRRWNYQITPLEGYTAPIHR